MLGIGFSHLRRPGEPLVQATPTEGGYCLDGRAPWVTGWASFDEFVMGATLPDGRALYGLVPLQDADCAGGGTVRCSEPMDLAAMGSTNTVSVELAGWLLPAERVLAVRPADRLQQRDRQTVLNHGFFALGCARAALDIVAAARERKPLAALQQAWQALDAELTGCREAMFAALEAEQSVFEQRLQLRSQAIELAGRCAQAAVVASGGAAAATSHPAQRVYCEALAFAVFGQTRAVMETSLARLSGCGGEASAG